jgi:hypothetical protein
VALWGAATFVFVLALAVDVDARGGGRGGGGFAGGGGFNRAGPAARGSFGRRPAGGTRRGYNNRGPAADGRFGERQELRQERRDERQDRREEVWEEIDEQPPEGDWQEYIEDHYDDQDYYYGTYYDEGVVYWELPCKPNVIAMGGVVYYTCGSTWYVRAYSDGEVVYTVVPNPTGH